MSQNHATRVNYCLVDHVTDWTGGRLGVYAGNSQRRVCIVSKLQIGMYIVLFDAYGFKHEQALSNSN